MRRQQLVVAIAAGVCLSSAACGARLSPSLHTAASNALLHAGGNSNVTGPSRFGNGNSTPSESATSGAQSGSQPSVGSSTGVRTQPSAGTPSTGSKHGGEDKSTATTGPSNQPSSVTSTTTASTGQTCPKSGTDVGLSATNINLGAVIDLTGPVNGLFTGAEQGVESFANYTNATGGFCGHSLHWDIADGGTNCGQTQNDTQTLAAKDFAFVGSFNLYDDCMASELKNYPTIADLHTGLNPSAISYVNHFDIASGTAGGPTGPFAYWAKEYPTQVKHVGTIEEDVPSADAQQASFEHAAESVGWKFVFSDNASPTASNWVSQFQTMCQKDGVKMVYIETEPVQSAATMMENESQAGCQGIINIIPIAYDAGFLPDYSGNVSQLKVLGYQEFPLYFNQPGSDRELATFQQWFARTNPGKDSSFYALYGWVYGRMFEQAYMNAGPVVTRTTLLAALKRMKNFTDNGMMPPSDPGTKTSGTHCYILWSLSGGKFSAVDDPSSGYRCDGKFLVDH